MTNKLLYSAESWDKVYTAFEQVNFIAYDYDTIKQSLLDYLKLNFSENFNDYTESSSLVALIELFAYVAEQAAYRVDMAMHENLITTARRKQSILRLVSLISYNATRNLPLRGLVKLTSVSSSEDIVDSQGTSLSNKRISWADTNNPMWREQFFLVINRLLISKYGVPYKHVQVDNIILSQYEINNLLEKDAAGTSFSNGVLPVSATSFGNPMRLELVPADLDDAGAFERIPNPNLNFSLLYADDGYGDASPMTGFMALMKEGTLQKLIYSFDAALPNRIIAIDIPNINDVDVWLHEVDSQGNILYMWEQVSAVHGDNLAFNTSTNLKRYQVETVEDDKIRLVFGSGDFAEMPIGIFNIWVRSSTSGNASLAAADLISPTQTFAYVSDQGRRESCTLGYTLTTTLQNSSPTEDIEHIRQTAPATYYTQDRMVNGQDYNSFMLKDPSILKLKAINRTFSGQPKHIQWNDASTKYQNVRLFGDDGRVFYDIAGNTTVYNVSSRLLIDQVLEAQLGQPGTYNLMSYVMANAPYPLNKAYFRPRITFLETLGTQEKTSLQGAIDRHWYGETTTVYLGPDLTPNTTPLKAYGLITGDVDRRVYDSNLKLVTYSFLTKTYTLVPIPNNASGLQTFAAKQKRFGIRFNPVRAMQGSLALSFSFIQSAIDDVYTIEIVNDSGTFTVHSRRFGLSTGEIGKTWANGVATILVTGTSPIVGDAFIVPIVHVGTALQTYAITKTNLLGLFEVVDDVALTPSAESRAFNFASAADNWLMIIQRLDKADGTVSGWQVLTRNFRLTFQSLTTKVYFDREQYLIDPETRLRVVDQVKLLKSNLNATGTAPLGSDHPYQVIGSFINADGTTATDSLLISPNPTTNAYTADGRPAASDMFLGFVGSSYVYFNRMNGVLVPVPVTNYLRSLTYVNDESGSIVRKPGREGIDFLWQHFAADGNMIDPSPSNIIDMFILTSGYYARLSDYIRGRTVLEPVPATPFELRSSYRELLKNKMLSDNVVLHPAKVKLMFGQKASPELRASLKVIKAPGSKLSDDQLRYRVLDVCISYFDVMNIDFGQIFYTTSLIAAIHKQLPLDIAAVVLVPQFPTNYYGDLMQVVAAPDEILVSAIELENIELVTDFNAINLRQKV
jgi:hypothetical protein